MSRYPEKKSSNLELRLTRSKKAAFMRACEENGVTASEVLRTFIDAYLHRSRSIKLKTLSREVAMTLIRNPIRTLSGASATLAAGFGLAFLVTGTSAAEDQYVQPLNFPTGIVYPGELAAQGIQGSCEVRFSVDTRGFVEPGAKASCTHDGFVRPAENAVYSLRFEPKLMEGKPERMTNLVYPFEFSLNYEPEESGK